MVTTGIFPFKENSHDRAGNRTRNLIVSSQRLWPLDHEAGHYKAVIQIFTSSKFMEILKASQQLSFTARSGFSFFWGWGNLSFARIEKPFLYTILVKKQHFVSECMGQNNSVGNSEWLRPIPWGDKNPVLLDFSASVQTSPGAHPDSRTRGTGSFLGG